MWHNAFISNLSQYGISGNLFQLVKSFLQNCRLRVVLNGQATSPGWCHSSPIFFLIYISDLSNHLSSNPKLFADDAHLFSVYSFSKFTKMIQVKQQLWLNWTYQWKMAFNPDPLKQVPEVIFLWKHAKTIVTPCWFQTTIQSKKVQCKNILQWF